MQSVSTVIKHVLPTVPGWCSVDKGINLACLVMAIRPRISLEIGIFAGRSLFPLALAHQAVKFGKVIGLDPWSPEESVKGQTEQHQVWWKNAGMHSNAESIARGLVQDHKLQPFCEIVKSTSDDYSPPETIGILHVDGNHSEQAVRDVRRYAPHVQPGGFVVMDDLTWDNGGPDRAAALLGPMGFRELYIIHQEHSEKDDYGVYQKA